MVAAVIELEQKKQTGTEENGAPPESALTQLMLGGLAAQSVYVAAKLGIADLLVDGPLTAAELADKTETDAPSLYRVLRALSALGVFVEGDDEKFSLTPMASLLRSGVQGSLRDCAIFMGEDWHWEVWGKTLYSVKTGNPAWKEVHGQPVFPYFATNQKASKIFDNAMSSFTTLAAKAVVEAYDFSSVRTLVDVAGGHGRLLTAILGANPNARGVLFDLPHVIAGARENINSGQFSSRVEFATGDFFVGVPVGGDAYVMKHIIHDWDDSQALRILKNIGKAMTPDGRVLLIESVISERNTPDFGKLMDIEMLVSPGGKERTARQYEELLQRAGMKLTRIIPTASPYSVIEAKLF